MSEDQLEIEPGTPTRRRVLAGAGMAGAAAGAAAILGACGTEPNSGFEIPPPPPPPESPGNPGGSGYGEDEPDGSEDDADDSADGANALAATSDVEVGGGLILPDDDVVITQPADGEWRGFSATCTHEGCKVSTVSDGTINCSCHGSRFSIQDGSVVEAAFGGDPSQQAPLPAVDIAVEDGQVLLA